MTRRPHDRGALLFRVLGVLAVVAGVLAMHGLTAHHDAAMAADHSMTDTVSIAPDSSMAPDSDGIQIARAAEEHSMMSACVAVLTGLVLLLALLLGLRNLLTWRPAVSPGPVARVVWRDGSPPWLAPSLSTLGVLRI